MKSNALPQATVALLLPIAGLVLAGCWTSPGLLTKSEGAPSLVGGMAVVETFKATATVQSVDAGQRKIVLKLQDGTTGTYKAGPEVINFDQIKEGDKVKTTVTDEVAIFLVKNGPLPSAGDGVMVELPAKGAMPAGMLLATQDFTARVTSVDRSYRMLGLEYADGHTKTFKVPLPFTLEHVQKGDDVVVRTTEAIAIRVK